MIRRIFSSLTSFKTITFKSGLNVLLAEKSSGASDRQTRNRAGKSSLIEIIHFLTGADCRAGSIFLHDDLKNHTFGIEFDLGGATISVERSGHRSNEVSVALLSGSVGAWATNVFADENEVTLTNTKWCDLLGTVMFGLTDDVPRAARKFRPKFRALFAYFVRRESAKGFLAPIRQSEKQSTWDQQVMVSFLLGLDWSIPREWELVRERESALAELRRAAAGGGLSTLVGRSATLRTEVALAEDRVARLRDAVGAFRVHPTYEAFEQEASRLTRLIRDDQNLNEIDRSLVIDLERALADETPPTVVDVEAVYRDAGVILAEGALRQFADVQRFHESIVENRRLYLQAELEAARARIVERDGAMRARDARRAELFDLLRSHGALEQLTSLQLELARKESEAQMLRARFAAAEQLESSRAKLELERRQLLLRLQQDHHEREAQLRKAIVAVEGVSGGMYEKPGRFIVEATQNGPVFDIKVDGDRSKGIGNMEIFCFDLMLLQLTMERGIGPMFLVHDSHLFDGVDARQRSHAILTGKRIANALGAQYIVTMNSDEWPPEDERPAGFDAEGDVLPVTLTDETETGGLFGLRFD